MIARELISSVLPLLRCSDTGQKAINIMESFRISHLPIVTDNEYIGLLADKNIYDRQMEMCCLKDRDFSLINPFVRENQHIYEVIQMMLDLKISVMPVLEQNGDYCGAITFNDLSLKFIELVGVVGPGAIIVLVLSPTDYLLTQIAQIVESNNAKILSLYTNSPKDSIELDVTLKLNVTDVSSIIETFVRYDYNIKAVYMDDSLLHDMYSERYDQFMRYLNV